MRPLFENESQMNGQSNIESTYQLLNSQLTHHHGQILPYFTYLFIFFSGISGK
jgi:hypothetical protein